MLTFIFNSIQLAFQGASWGKREKLEKKVKAVVGVHKDFGITVCVLGNSPSGAGIRLVGKGT